MVVNAMIATAAEQFHDSGSHTVYHVGSSNQNPVMYKQIYKIIIRYFMESLLVGRNGMLIVPNVTTIWLGSVSTRTFAINYLYRSELE